MLGMSGYKHGHKVRVVLPGDPYTGRVGTVHHSFLDDDGDLIHVVRFCDDRDAYPHHTPCYVSDELVSAED
jgi:hypothetical protein